MPGKSRQRGVVHGACLGLLLLGGLGAPDDSSPPSPEAHRSPTDLAVVADGRYVLTANHTSDSISLVDLEAGKVRAEVAVGHKPAAVVCAPDGRTAAVSNLWSGCITFLDLVETGPKARVDVTVGGLPRGLVFAQDGRRLYAAVSGCDEVVVIDTTRQQILQRWPAPREPRHLALSPDGALLAVSGNRSPRVSVWNTRTGQLHWQRAIEDGFNLRGLAFLPDGQSLVCAHNVRRSFPVSQKNIEEGWVIDSRMTRFPLEPGAVPPLYQVALDTRGRAVGDPHVLALGPAGSPLILTASGTHEMLVFRTKDLAWNGGDPGDFLAGDLAKNQGSVRRLTLGGRPTAAAFLPDRSEVVVANYLLDAVQVVDVRAGRVKRTIPLGGPARPEWSRRGEALFYDARRSHHQWFSCHTCHVDGHTCGLTFDTLNDDSYGNPKLTPSLRGVTRTGPWTWHGWQKDLGAAVEKSLTQTMFGPRPEPDEVKALVSFLGTLDHPPHLGAASNGRKDLAVGRGRMLFEGKARCARCHKGPEYTSEHNYDVKLEPDDSPYPLWNPPSLRGLWDRGPFLHDGRAATLDELLQKHHAPELLGGQPLSPGERQDLVTFLLSL